MKIEQKAKAYDEAIRKAKDMLSYKEVRQEDMEYLFPELKESENERIRKSLITFFQRFPYGSLESAGISPKEAIAWLEKQGKPALEAVREEKVDNQNCAADNVESKFKACDWIINSEGTVAHINNVKEDIYGILRYYIEFSNGIKSDPMPCFVDCEYHLWTIADVKDGDVLADKDNNIGIFQECEDTDWNSYIYLGCDGKLRGFSIGGCHEQIDTHPATKEQSDILFKAMANAGYTFDFEKKELKKINNK